jgi:hypothetical protein
MLSIVYQRSPLKIFSLVFFHCELAVNPELLWPQAVAELRSGWVAVPTRARKLLLLGMGLGKI